MLEHHRGQALEERVEQQCRLARLERLASPREPVHVAEHDDDLALLGHHVGGLSERGDAVDDVRRAVAFEALTYLLLLANFLTKLGLCDADGREHAENGQNP